VINGGLGANWRAPSKNSEEFRYLESRLGSDLSSNLKNIQGFKRVALNSVKKEGNDKAIVRLELMVVPESELSRGNRVERGLNESISTGKVGSFRVDPEFLVFKNGVLEGGEEEAEVEVYRGESFHGDRFWIIVGCVAGLILLALVQAGVTVCKGGRRAGNKDSTPSSTGGGSGGMAWRDYSETNYGYDAYEETKTPQAEPPSNAMQMQPQNHHHHYASPAGYNNMSLPRPTHVSSGGGSYNSQSLLRQSSANGNGNGLSHNPDFYFMPSQRKYSGEMVRVYVDNAKR